MDFPLWWSEAGRLPRKGGSRKSMRKAALSVSSKTSRSRNPRVSTLCTPWLKKENKQFIMMAHGFSFTGLNICPPPIPTPPSPSSAGAAHVHVPPERLRLQPQLGDLQRRFVGLQAQPRGERRGRPAWRRSRRVGYGVGQWTNENEE